jgi:hypothetical protein
MVRQAILGAQMLRLESREQSFRHIFKSCKYHINRLPLTVQWIYKEYLPLEDMGFNIY